MHSFRFESQAPQAGARRNNKRPNCIPIYTSSHAERQRVEADVGKDTHVTSRKIAHKQPSSCLRQEYASTLVHTNSSSSTGSKVPTVFSKVDTNDSTKHSFRSSVSSFEQEEEDVLTDFMRELVRCPHILSALQSANLDLAFPTANPTDDTNEILLSYPICFNSLCISDPKLKGGPVRLKSCNFLPGPESLKVGDCHFLNTQVSKINNCCLTSRPDSKGQTQYILQYVTNLTGHECDTPAFTLASQMDVTNTLHQLATIFVKHRRRVPIRVKHDLQLNELGVLFNTGISSPGEALDRTEVAQEEKQPCKTSIAAENVPKILIPHKDPALVEFHELVKDIRFFHKYCFTLSPAMDGQGFWQITWMSCAIQDRPEDVAKSLSHTDTKRLLELSRLLGKKDPMSMKVKWGVEGKDKLIYCVPMLDGAKLDCWVCFLVDANVPLLW